MRRKFGWITLFLFSICNSELTVNPEVDTRECMDRNGSAATVWSHMQKPVACTLCVAGVVLYAMEDQRSTSALFRF